jgi:Na+/phosphate symporter
MSIFSVIMLIGGLAFFLYGMYVMSTGLERMAGGKLERTLKKMTSSKFKSIVFGMGITIAIQSSSAVTVMLVGLVNSGIMQISQTIGIIMGSNIGTTLTAWILSLIGIQSDNVWIGLLKPQNFSLIFAFVGVMLIMAAKSNKNKDIGNILIGFAVLMFGMNLMSDAVSPLANIPEFASILTAFENPILGVAVGAIFTGIIQSSAASIGILQALALTGSVNYGMAIPIIMGQNIGTCVTALLSSINVSRNAKKVAVIHISFNFIGTVIFLLLYYGIDTIVRFSFTSLPINAVGIAMVHSIFNVATTALLLPFSGMLEKIANFVLKDNKADEDNNGEVFLDSLLLDTPSIAVSECCNVSVDMAVIAKKTLLDAIQIVGHYDEKMMGQILENEDIIDGYEDKIGSYLVKISAKALSEVDTRKSSRILHAIGDFERLGDHAVNLAKTAKELNDKEMTFSDEAIKELDVLTKAITEILEIAILAYQNDDVQLATKVEPLEQVIDYLISTVKAKHIGRLQMGLCTVELGFILSDILNNYERVSDHCSNIAVAIIEVAHNSFDTHKYLNAKKYGDSEFDSVYETFKAKYDL